jgi:hypothetical protein
MGDPRDNLGGTGGGGGAGNGNGNNNATSNRGGGGGGAGDSGSGGNGGSGIVILRTEQAAITTTGSPVATTSGSYYIYQFNATGSITF